MSDALKMIKPSDPWYKNGLSFKCTGCGRCCTGAPGYTWVSDDEIQNISAYLQISTKEFGNRYLRYVDGKYSLRENQNPENKSNFDCVFLKNKKCEVYPVRPKQCQTFPWWARNLNSVQDWEKAAAYCEGINHIDAPLTSFETIQKNLDS